MISPKRVIFVGTRISIRFQLTLIGFQTYISGIIIAGVSRDGDRSIEGGGRGGGGGYFINAKSTLGCYPQRAAVMGCRTRLLKNMLHDPSELSSRHCCFFFVKRKPRHLLYTHHTGT